MMKTLIRMAALLTVVLSLAGCVDEEPIPEGVIKALATTGMVSDTVLNVGGEHVHVTTLMGPGVDPHLYKASAGDINRLSRADVIFYSGLHLEGKMVEVLSKIARTGKPTFAVSEELPEGRIRASQQYEGFPDPHIWFDVELWSETVDVVAEKLSEMEPENAEEFAANAAIYKKELLELDAYCRRRIAEIPERQRVLITAHDAFSYFGAAYGIRVVGLQGINTSSEYGIADVQRLVRLIVDNGVKAVFIESSVPRRAIEAVVEGTRARGGEVRIGGELYSDAMGEAGTPDGTYIGMVRHNVDTIVDALK